MNHILSCLRLAVYVLIDGNQDGEQVAMGSHDPIVWLFNHKRRVISNQFLGEIGT